MDFIDDLIIIILRTTFVWFAVYGFIQAIDKIIREVRDKNNK